MVLLSVEWEGVHLHTEGPKKRLVQSLDTGDWDLTGWTWSVGSGGGEGCIWETEVGLNSGANIMLCLTGSESPPL